MDIFYITFGQQSALRNFYVEIIAPSQGAAFDIATLEFKHIAFIYDLLHFNDADKKYYPEGCLCCIKYNPANNKAIAKSIT
jgi:hypothetical protein